VPPLLLGLPGDNTFSNYAEANRAFWRQTVLPLVARVQKSFQAWLQPGFGPFRLDYNADRLEALASERASEWERVGKAAFLTLDEQREALGYGPAPKEALFAKRDVALERRYSPDQPRVPAGSSGGGQWTGGGGGDSRVGFSGARDDRARRRDAEDRVRTAMNANPNVASDADSAISSVQHRSFEVDLAEEQGGDHEGHGYSEHVGKTEDYLRNRVRNSLQGNRYLGQADTRAGSFTSLEAANKLVNSTLSQNRSIVEAVIKGQIGKARIQSIFRSETGIEAYTDKPWDPSAPITIRDTFGVAVIILRNIKSPRGFSIVTAFPFSD
jgi:hypothetical protein